MCILKCFICDRSGRFRKSKYFYDYKEKLLHNFSNGHAKYRIIYEHCFKITFEYSNVFRHQILGGKKVATVKTRGIPV